jgi:hypothetical protein
MPLHWIKTIHSGHLSTQRLFELGMSFGACKRARRWPSLATMNSFLAEGRDEGELGTTIEWDPCTLTSEEYQRSIDAFMKGEPYEIDAAEIGWEEWFDALAQTRD